MGRCANGVSERQTARQARSDRRGATAAPPHGNAGRGDRESRANRSAERRRHDHLADLRRDPVARRAHRRDARDRATAGAGERARHGVAQRRRPRSAGRSSAHWSECLGDARRLPRRYLCRPGDCDPADDASRQSYADGTYRTAQSRRGAAARHVRASVARRRRTIGPPRAERSGDPHRHAHLGDARRRRRSLSSRRSHDRQGKRRSDRDHRRPVGGREGCRLRPVPARFRSQPDRHSGPAARGWQMIARIIAGAIRARFAVVLAALVLVAVGIGAIRTTPVHALPDLSHVHVIIRTSYPGQAPQIVENQVSYLLATTMLSSPGARVVRGYSFVGDSFVYVLFDDGTDLYWARSRVLEYLSQVQGRLPQGATASIGPDATGVGWIYEYALVDRTGQHDLQQLRSLQDWFLRYELKSVPGVAEVASIGGMVKQYQVLLDPQKLASYGVTQAQVADALKRANSETGGSVVEMAEAEYVVRSGGYLKSLDDFRAVPIRTATGGVPVTLGDVATVQIGPDMRRGVAELNGEGEVAGGVIVMRQGKNAREVLDGVKAKLADLRKRLPPGVEVVTTYDRSGLIDRAVDNLTGKLIEEFLVVAIVCALFLWHVRSALVAIITLPLGILAAFVVMRAQGGNANIMSLGGIAIAIGAMVDAAVVMIENAHKHLERAEQGRSRVDILIAAASEVGPARFFSLLIITVSFMPIFTLESQEGRLFSPLAFTKTFAMAAAALLSVTLVPALMVIFVRGRIIPEHKNPINRFLIWIYRPVIKGVMQAKTLVILLALAVLAVTVWPARQLGSEFMPNLNEGTLLYMPTTLPGISVTKAAELLQTQDRIIRSFPEVASVFGKAGRASTATDQAPS